MSSGTNAHRMLSLLLVPPYPLFLQSLMGDPSLHLHLESDQNYSRFAIVADGPTHTHGELDNGLRGVYRTVRIGRALDACAFLVVDDGTLVCKDDTRMWLESDHGRKEPDTTVLLWGVDCVPEKHEWAKKYVFEKDGTIAPAQNPHGVCLGVQEDEHATPPKVVFVKRTDMRRRLVFARGPVLEQHMAIVEEMKRARLAERAALKERICSTVITRTFCETLKRDGFVALENAVPTRLIRQAKREINRRLGAGAANLNAKTFTANSSITDLLKESAVPMALSKLLGGDDEYWRSQITSGQIALRFPGDACPNATNYDDDDDDVRISASHFDGVRRYWHIDGIPGESNGLSYGKIHNFDCLCGVLLSDVQEPMSGELCVYPGSHVELAEYFSNNTHVLETLCVEGKGLPSGPETDALFKRRAVHCLGKQGDVFLVNYMTAHFVAPNASPDIRYAVYFRVSSSQHDGGNISILAPWIHWDGLNRMCPDRHGGSSHHESDAIESLSAMFPDVERAVVMDVLAACHGNSDSAAEHLLQLLR